MKTVHTLKGQREFLGGKLALIRVGHFDDVAPAMLIHTPSRPENKLAGVAVSHNGCVVKTIRYTGRAAHTSSAPHLGIWQDEARSVRC